MWRVVAERSRSPDLSSGVFSSRVWVRYPVMTLVPLSKALNHNCFEKVGKVVHSALPDRLLVDDTHAYILKDCEGGNPVSAPGVGGNVPLVSIDLGR